MTRTDEIMALADQFAADYMPQGSAVQDHMPSRYDRLRDATVANRAALRAAVEKLERENDRLRLHIDKRAAGTEKVALYGND